MAYWCDDRSRNIEQRRLDAAQADALKRMEGAKMPTLKDTDGYKHGPDSPREIDFTPTWKAAMPILIAALEDGTPEGKRMAREELMSLAADLDRMNMPAKAA